MKFTHLHTHSHYSLLDGLAKIDELLDTCQSLGMDSLALTDHGNMYGAVEFYKKAKEKNIKPIIGCEVYVAPRTRHDRQPRVDDRPGHLVLLVKNETGYRNLVRLVTKSFLDGFYYKPRVDKELLKEHHEGLIASSACLAGELPRLIKRGKPQAAEKRALIYRDIFGPGNFYLELQCHPHIPEQAKINQILVEISRKNNIPLIATNDIHYVHPEDAEAQDVLMSVQMDKKTDDESRLSMKGEDFSMKPPKQMIDDFKSTPEAIANTQKIVEACSFEFELCKYEGEMGKLKLPHFEIPGGKKPIIYLRELCQEGLKRRQFETPMKEVLARLEHELNMIEKTDFTPYVLITWDFMRWGREKNIVSGPGRGSCVGSLVLYLIGVTDVDPLKYGLFFERWLHPDRNESPDVDLDFADDRRDEVIEYVREKYGQDQVAQIITFGTMAARAAIRDVGRALSMPYSFCDRIAKLIPFGCNLQKALETVPELKTIYQTEAEAERLIDMAKKLEGVVRHASTHACGVVIAPETLDNIIPRQYPSQKESNIVTQYEMHSVGHLGLLKMDFLGLKTLTVIQNTLNQIREDFDQEIDLGSLPLDDEQTLELFRQANTTGVFQMESGGFKRHLKDLKPTKFDDLIAMVALYRPGPMESIPDFIERKHGRKPITYPHPKLEPILKNTYGVITYQEQLLRIVRELGGFNFSEADVFRRAVGKKIKKLLEAQRIKFFEGMAKNSIDEKSRQRIWDLIAPFARYGFNLAHSACYATIAYRTAYLKAHYPTEFMAALMTSEQNDIERISFLVEECKQIGVTVLPPNINESNHDFSRVKDDTIRFGLKVVKNVGHNVVQAIVDERKANGAYQSITDFIERVQTRDLNKKSLESLIKCGALDIFGERNQLLQSLDQLLSLARETQKAKDQGQINLFGEQAPVSIPSFQLAQAQPVGKRERLRWEKELLGLYVSEHPLTRWEDKIRKVVSQCSDLTIDQVGQLVKTGGIVTRVKKINTRRGDPMAFAEIEDLTGRIETVVFPGTLAQTADAWQEDKIILVKGKLDNRDGNLKILCEGVKILE